MSANLTTAAKWAVALPFFVLPISLTIDAPDVHGGYGLHLRQAAALAGAGVTVWAMARAWTRLEAHERARPWMTAALLAIPWLLAGHGLVVLGSWLAETFGGTLPSLAHPNQQGGLKPWTRGVVCLGVAAVGIQAGAKPAWAKVGAAMALMLGGVYASAAIGLGAASDLGVLPQLPAVGTALVAAVGFRWHRGTLGGRASELAATIALLLVGGGLGFFGSSGLGAIGESVPTAWGGGGAVAYGPPVSASWIVLCAVAAWRLPRQPEPELVLGALGWGAASVITSAAAGVPAISETVCLSLIGAIGFADGGRREGPWKVALLGPAVLGLVLGGPLGRYGADLLGLTLAPTTAAAIGSVLAVAGGGAFATLRLGTPRPGPVLAVLLALLASPVLAIYVAIAWGLEPLSTLLFGAAAAALAATPRVPAPVSLVGFWYACFVVVATFKLGPSPADCAAVEGELLLPAAPGAQAYDVLPTADGVLASFKRIDRRGGYFEVFDPTDPTRRSKFETRRAAGDGPLWPERLERDPRTGNVWSQVLGIGAYGMWEVSVQPGPQVVVVRRRPITWEPGNPVIDTTRNRLVLTYVPNRGARNPLIEAIRLDNLRAEGPRKPGPRLEMADFVAFDEVADRFYVPAVVGRRGFVLNEYDGALQVTRSRVQFHPSVGVAGDAGVLWLTNPLGGTLEVLNDLEVIQTLDAGTFPRDLLVDSERRRLYVGAYSSGEVHAFDIGKDGTLTVASATSVGSLLRGIGLDPRTGDVYAASGCGVLRVAYSSGSIVH